MQPFNDDDYVVAARQRDTSYTLLSDPRNEVKDTILKLNKWKEAFMAAHGRKPKASDMRADLEIAGIFAAYEKLKNEKKRQSDNLTQETNPPVVFQSEQEAKESAEGHSREDDHASKILKRKLKEWKTDFIEKNGRNPKRSDIEADSYAAPLFKEYNTLS
eukprot:Tbor_TRINITY_DN5990_c0_g2::TRINITY_DN5990_c0_g2_i8::g.19218::m.19218